MKNIDIITAVIKHLAGRHNQKLHAAKHSQAIPEVLAQKLGDIAGWPGEWYQKFSSVGDWPAFEDITCWVDQGGDKGFARDLLRTLSAGYLSETFNNPLYSDASKLYFSGNTWLKLESVNDDVEHPSRTGVLLPPNSPIVSHINRNPVYESALGMVGASYLYLKGARFLDFVGNMLPNNKVATQYVMENNPLVQPNVESRDFPSPTAWYLVKQGVQLDDVDSSLTLDWRIADWYANKYTSPQLDHPRVLHVEGGDDLHYAYRDMLDELKPDDLVNGVNTTPDTAFERAIIDRQQKLEAWNQAGGYGVADPYMLGPEEEPDYDEDYGDGLSEEKMNAGFPEAAPSNQYIRQLRSRQELLDEGQTMSNCVGGYGRMCESGRTAVYTVKVGNEKANMQVARAGRKWVIKELRGPVNQEASDTIKDVVRSWATENDVRVRSL